MLRYEPAESSSAMYGGNSNWRGPIWFPVNYLMIESLQVRCSLLSAQRVNNGTADSTWRVSLSGWITTLATRSRLSSPLGRERRCRSGMCRRRLRPALSVCSASTRTLANGERVASEPCVGGWQPMNSGHNPVCCAWQPGPSMAAWTTSAMTHTGEALCPSMSN